MTLLESPKPSDYDAEDALLSLMINSEGCAEDMVKVCKTRFFYWAFHKQVFKVIRLLVKDGIHVNQESFLQRFQEEVSDKSRLLYECAKDIVGNTPKVANPHYYLFIILEKYIERCFIDVEDMSAKALDDNLDYLEKLVKHLKLVREVLNECRAKSTCN